MEDYCTYEQAVKLKELGFGWNCRGSYNKSGRLKISAYTYNFNDGNEWSKYTYSAPTLAQAQKWLREVKDICVLALKCAKTGNSIDGKYRWEIRRETDGKMINCACGWYGIKDTYEQTLSAGIDKALELLKEEGYGIR